MQETLDRPPSLVSPSPVLPRSTAGPHRKYLGTWYAPEETLRAYVDNMVQLPVCAKTFAGQVEQCPRTGRYHLQFFIHLNKPERIGWVQRELGMPGAHLEAARGTNDQCIQYVMKDESRAYGPFLFDSSAGTKKISPCELYVAAVKNGKSILDIVSENPKSLSMIGTLMKLKGLFDAHRWPSRPIPPPDVDAPSAIKVTWLSGGTGTGKTRRAKLEATTIAAERDWGTDAVYTKTVTGKWWEGYTSQPLVIVDEWNPCEPSVEYWLQVLDRYDVTVEIKGGAVKLNAHYIWVTSNITPLTLYQKLPEDKHEHVRALVRRFDDIIPM